MSANSFRLRALLSPLPSGGINFAERLNLGPGGYVTTMDIAPTGEMMVACDTVGAYNLNLTTNKWEQIANPSNLGRTIYESVPSCIKVVTCPTLTSRRYGIFRNATGTFAFARSDNKGEDWTFNDDMDFVGDDGIAYRGNDQQIAVDPNNEDVVYIGCSFASSTNKGLWFSKDGGVSFDKITGVTDPSAIPGITGIVFDKTDGTVLVGGQTRTKNIVACSGGEGMFRSTDGGGTEGTFSHVADSPGVIFNMSVIDFGTYAGWHWACVREAPGLYPDAVYKWKSGSGWTRGTFPAPYVQSGNDLPCSAIACSPTVSGDIIFIGAPGMTCMAGARTLDNGDTFLHWVDNNALAQWSYVTGPDGNFHPTQGGDVPWMQYALQVASIVNFSRAVRDYSNNNRVWVTTGVGVFYIDWVDSDAHFFNDMHYTGATAGIEQLVVSNILSVPGNSEPIVSVHDRSTIATAAGNEYPTDYLGRFFLHSYCSDYASSDPSYVIAWGNQLFNADAPYFGESEDYGRDGTFTVLSAQPVLHAVGGCLGCATPTSAVAVPFYQGFTNQPQVWNGTSWANCGGFSAAGAGEWPTAGGGASTAARLVAANRTRIGEYMIYKPDDGFYISTDGGLEFSALSGTAPLSGGSDYGRALLTNLPCDGDWHLWSPANANNSGLLWFNPNNCAAGDWDTDPTFDVIFLFGVGKIKTGNTVNRVWVVGRVVGAPASGIYYTDEIDKLFNGTGTPTWVEVTDNFVTFCDTIAGVRGFAADLNDEKKAYIGTNGQGAYILHSAA